MQLHATEHQLCATFVRRMAWLKQQGAFSGRVHKNQNEGKRGRRAAAIAHAEGLLPGVADYTVSSAGRVAYIEFKGWSKGDRKGQQSHDQKVFQADCERDGTPYLCVWSDDDAIRWLQGLGFINPAWKGF